MAPGFRSVRPWWDAHRSENRVSRRRPRRRCLGVLLWEAHQFTLREVRVEVLRPARAPYGYCNRTDLHLTPRQEDKMAWVRSLAQLEPDFVILTGDLLGHMDAVPYLAKTLEPPQRNAGRVRIRLQRLLEPEDRQPFWVLHQGPHPGDVHTATTDRRTGIRTAERRMAGTEQCRG